MRQCRLAAAAVLLTGSLCAAAEAKPAEIADVRSLAALRKLAALKTIDGWEIRAATAPAGKEFGPWRLLYVHLRYVGKGRVPELWPAPSAGSMFHLGPIGWTVDYTSNARADFREKAQMLRDTDRSIYVGQDKWVERLYCAALPMAAAGKYRIQLFSPEADNSRVLAEQTTIIRRAIPSRWLGGFLSDTQRPVRELIKKGQKPTAANATHRIEPQPSAMIPTFEADTPVWVLLAGETFVETPVNRTSLPGQLPAADEWLTFRPGLEGRLKGKQAGFVLKLTAGDGYVVLETSQKRNPTSDNLLARWWVNGKAVAVGPPKLEAEKVLAAKEAMFEETQKPDGTRRIVIALDVPEALGAVGAADTIGLQVMFCPNGTRRIRHPHNAEMAQQLAALEPPGEVTVPILSNRIEFKGLERPVPARIGRVRSLAQLRRLDPVRTINDWEIRLATAPAGPEPMPWRLLYVHIRYVGYKKSIPYPGRARRGLHRVGPLGYSLDYSRSRDKPYREEFGKISDGWSRALFPGETEWGERLYCASLPMPAAGRYRLRVYGPGPWGSVPVARQEITVRKDTAKLWTDLMRRRPGAPQDTPRPRDGWEVRPDPWEHMPRYSDTAPLWVLHRGEVFVETETACTSLPGQLPGEMEWFRFRPGRKGNVAPDRERPVLKLTAKGGRLVLDTLNVPDDASRENLLARWWINDRPAPMLPANRALAKEMAEALLREGRNDADPLRRYRIGLLLPSMLKGAKPGDTVCVQVMYCPDGSKRIYHPGGLRLQDRARAERIHSDRSPAVVLSNRAEFRVTAKLIRQSRAAAKGP